MIINHFKQTFPFAKILTSPKHFYSNNNIVGSQTKVQTKIQNDIDNLLGLFFRNRQNLVSNEKREEFRKSNKTSMKMIESAIENVLKSSSNTQEYIHFSKYLSLISENKALQLRLFDSFIQNHQNMKLGSVIETSWIFCLLEEGERKKNLYDELAKKYFTHNIKPDFTLNYSTSYKVMLSQLRFDANQFNIELLSKVNGVENLEQVSLEEIPISQFEEIGDQLKNKGLEIVSTNKFFEIYNLGIELEKKIILDLWRSENKEIGSIFKLIRIQHLKKAGFAPISLIVDNLKNVNIDNLCKSIKESAPKNM